MIFFFLPKPDDSWTRVYRAKNTKVVSGLDRAIACFSSMYAAAAEGWKGALLEAPRSPHPSA